MKRTYDHKTSFVLYCDLIHTIEKLSNVRCGILFKAILEYVNNLPVDLTDDQELNEIYAGIVKDIEYEWSKYNPQTKRYHWNYKGGITPVNKQIRESLAYKRWRTKVFKRDRYTCTACGNIGGELNAHHIKEFAKHEELRLDIDNGLTLCRPCHIKTHSKHG